MRSKGGVKVSEEERRSDEDGSDGREPFARAEDFLDEGGEIRFAPSDRIGEWVEEIERWLPEAVGYSIFGVLVMDLSDLRDFMETDLENPRTDESITGRPAKAGDVLAPRSCGTGWT
jgi:hypothetical protein